jgi:hypothetical protein
MGSVISWGLEKTSNGVSYALIVVVPVFKIMTYFMGFVLIMTFIGNIAGILGFFIFMAMFYYYVKGIIFIEPP